MITRSRNEIITRYAEQIQQFDGRIEELKKTKRLLAIFRLIVVVSGISLCWRVWPAAGPVLLTLLFFCLLFVVLVFTDANNKEAIQHLERLIRINRHEMDVMTDHRQGYENGGQFAEAGHAYAADLDLFGPDSLFQFLNRCHADQSRKLLADCLKSPLTAAFIKEKQTGIRELSEKQYFCHQFRSTAMAHPLTDQTEHQLKQCIDAPSPGFNQPFWKWIQYIYPLFPVATVILFISDKLSVNLFLIIFSGFYLISYLISRKIASSVEMLLGMEPVMHAVYQQFLLFENEVFRSPFLTGLQSRLKPRGYSSTTVAIGRFNGILKKNDWRSNILVNLLLQIFFWWDLRLIISLNEWKNKNRQSFREWFPVIAETEVMISLASLMYNEPGWCLPEMDEVYFHFHSEALGHPLIPASTRVTNDFAILGTGKIALITGSNMAGKSTFLRSLGINLVLAGTGAPVCAREMSGCSVKLISSMRVADNLAENTSTFYAELKKLQSIIEAVNRDEHVFILLDEVLRGTNSTDRHKGSRALVRQLMESRAVTVMATHDTELAHSESANPAVSNFHFEGKIENEELSFDYKIKNGICESLNATTLMKKIGIRFQD